MSTEQGRIHVDELNHPEKKRDPRINRTDQHIQRLKTRYNESGWLSPIVFTTDNQLIVDGNTRVRALKEFDQNGDDEYLQILYEIQGYTFAIPNTDLDIDPEEASAELNTFRENLTEPERAQFLSHLVEARIIDNEEVRVAGDAISVPTLVSNLENDKRDDRKYNWEHDQKAKENLEKLLSSLDFDSPGRARTVLTNYEQAPQKVGELWALDELYSGHVEVLNKIRSLLDDGANLDQSSTAQHNQFEDLIEYSRKEYQQEDDYYARDDLRSIANELDNNQESDDEDVDVDEDEFEEFKRETLNDKHQEQAERIADYEDDLSTEKVLKKCYNSHKNGDDFIQELNEAIQEIEELEREMEERKEERRQALSNLDFDTDSKFAHGDADHLAPPVEMENLGVFFHDCLQMDDEVNDESVQLVFTSPPYFTQRGRIVDEWWPDGEEKTQVNADTAYENYLSAMMSVFEKCHDKLAEGGYLMLNISDYMVGGLSKVYDIPSDFSYRLRHVEELNLKYISTITWDKDSKTGSRLANFRKSNNIADFKPAWQTERILVFRKGGKREKQDYTVDREALKRAYGNVNPFSDVWKAAPTTKSDAAHEAGFPVKLPELAVKLFTYPGDTVIDPFGGFATTLRAVKQVNEDTADAPPRKGLAWENFASETNDQVDYRKQIESQLGGLGSFMS